MKKLLAVMSLCAMVLFLAASCGDESTVIEGSVPVTVEGPVNVLDIGTCTNNIQCVIDEVCEEVDDFESSQGKTVPVSMCIFGCTAELKTEVTTNDDGTSVTVISKVEGSDTCQRDGNTALTCDMKKASKTFRQCIANDVVQPTEPVVVDPVVEPEEPVEEPMVDLVECCYDNVQPDQNGVFAWSVSTEVNPEGWLHAVDLKINSQSGCFSFKAYAVQENMRVDLTNGFYPEVTTDLPDDFWATFWVAENNKPRVCRVNGVEVPVGDFSAGWLVDYEW